MGCLDFCRECTGFHYLFLWHSLSHVHCEQTALPGTQPLCLGKRSVPVIFAEHGAMSGGWMRWHWKQRCEHLQEWPQRPSVTAIRVAAIQPRSEFIKSERILVITVDYGCCPCPYVSISWRGLLLVAQAFFHFIMIAQHWEKSGFSEDIATSASKWLKSSPGKELRSLDSPPAFSSQRRKFSALYTGRGYIAITLPPCNYLN